MKILDIPFIKSEHFRMDLRRLEMLLELSRLGSMREVSEELAVTTSTVSQQIAALSREVGAELIEPDGRRVRITPAGRRLADHAVGILAAVEAARSDLDPDAEPSGTVRVAGFATAVRRSLLPALTDLARSHPRIELRIHEHEPAEAFALLASDDLDLALTYDFGLAPAVIDRTLRAVPLWTAPWGLAVPPAVADPELAKLPAAQVVAHFADQDWIVNSRNSADEQVLTALGSLADVEVRVTHRADSLDLVEDFVLAGLGVGLFPEDDSGRKAVAVLPLRDPDIALCAFAVTRRGREHWPPLRAVLHRLGAT